MDLFEKVVSLSKRRGIILGSSEIYGGLASIYDYGHYGLMLKNNIKNYWWKDNVLQREDMLGLDSAIILSPKVWSASGHLSSFSDPLVECKSCHLRYRLDFLALGKYGKTNTFEGKLHCPACDGILTEEKKFNLMFKTHIGPTEDTASTIYLRPETAQGIFINFKNILNTYSKKIPFGIAQIGKAFRNEITPQNFIFRMREFEQMEIEYFVEPGSDEKWHDFWLKNRLKWYFKYGIKKNNLRLRKHEKDELSHYSKATYDIEYQFPWGWGEVEGIANRTDFDLKKHQLESGRNLEYYDKEKNKSFIPYVIEPSVGVDRLLLMFLLDSYTQDEKRVLLKLNPLIAPIKAAILPLVANKPDIITYARKIYLALKEYLSVYWDERGNIGQRYYAQDEIGTPWCITIDYNSLNDDTVTIRDRDTTKQIRIHKNKLKDFFNKNLFFKIG